MTREVKKPEIRKNEILDTAQKFFFQKGYKQTSVQDIIDDLRIAKGTFYHYFQSKKDLLDELTERMTSEMAAELRTIIDTDKTAIEKFNEFFLKGTSFKAANIELFVVLIKTLYTDENTIMREKMFRWATQKYRSIFSAIANQGIQEGVFNTPYPEELSEMILQLGKTYNEYICRLFIEHSVPADELIDIIRNKMNTWQDTIERILGAPKGTIRVYNLDEVEELVRLFYERMQRKEDK